MFRRGLAGRHKEFQRSFDADAFARDPPANDTETNDEIQRLAAAGRGQIDLGRHRLPAAFLAPVDAQAQGIDVGCRVVGGSTHYRSEEHTSELQSLIRMTDADVRLKNTNKYYT